ncbi:MAG TPA: adenylyltransferase, partial [Deltaproteobacteria bacterium]|nr:adenylyltransferase [Deltaproteobacteria bacterium]
MSGLIKPHGGKLRRLLASSTELQKLNEEVYDLPSVSLTPRQLCDLELLLNGAFSPLGGFMTRKEYVSVLDNVALPDDTVWPIPITLDVPASVAQEVKEGDRLVLRDQEGFALAVMTIEDK